MERFLVFGLLSVALISIYEANGASVFKDPFFHSTAGKAHLASKSGSGHGTPSHSKSGGQKKYIIGRRNNTDECMADADIILSFDDSSSIRRDSPENFAKMLKFMESIVSKFGQVGPNNTRFAAITFSVGVKPHFNLDTYKTKEEIVKGIEKIKPSYGGATAMGDALKYVKDKGFKEGRKGVQQILILVTDGKNNGQESPLYHASKLKKRNVAIIPVGIGKGFRLDELKHIASRDEYVLTTDSFGKLATLIDAVVALACDVCPEKKGTAGAAGKTGHTFPAPPPPAPAPPPPAPAPPPAKGIQKSGHTWEQQPSGHQVWGQQPSVQQVWPQQQNVHQHGGQRWEGTGQTQQQHGWQRGRHQQQWQRWK